MNKSTLLRLIPLPALLYLLLVGIGPFIFDMYLVNILIKSFFFAIAVITVDILWGYTGYLTFGQSAFFGIGAYCAGLIFTYQEFSDATIILAISLAVVVSAGVGLCIGLLSFYRGAAPFFACIISLVLPITLSQLILSLGSFTGSSSGLTGFDTFEFDMDQWYWISGGLLTVIALLSWYFVSSDFGKVLVAIRDNESRCEYLGLNPAKIKIVLLTCCAAIAGVAGFGYGSFSGVVAPELTGFGFGTELIMWVALSGRGTLWGPVIGTLIISVVSSYLSNSMPFVWQFILGAAFVAVIIFLPKGLVPILLKPLMPKDTFVPELAEAEHSDSKNDGLALQMSRVAKSYGSLKVLRDITFCGKKGEVVGIIGPNGAGKTTLMRCMSDGGERTGGKVFLNGVEIENSTPQHCVALGLGRKFQNANIFQSMTVAECLRIARSIRDRPSLVKNDAVLCLPPYALEVMKATKLDSKLGVLAMDLSHGEQQALELTMVLSLEPKVVLLDEPTAGLTLQERAQIGDVFRSLAEKYNLCCLLVEHDLDFVKELANKIVVLHQGTILMSGSPVEVVESELVQSIYAGNEVKEAA